MLKEVNLENFVPEVIERDAPVLVDFYSPDCAPCRRLAPILEGVSAEGFRIVKVNVNEPPGAKLADKLKVTVLPTLILFNGYREVTREFGFKQAFEIKDLFQTKQVGS